MYKFRDYFHLFENCKYNFVCHIKFSDSLYFKIKINAKYI